MKIRLLVFSHLRDAAGFGEADLELPEGSDAAALLDRLCADHPALNASRDSIRIAVNQEYVASSHSLKNGDEVALMPPVQGG